MKTDQSLRHKWIRFVSLFIAIGLLPYTISAQSLYREYSDNNVYIYIDNSTQQYWTGSPRLPHHKLVITNIGSQNVSVRALIRVVLRDGNGNYLDETTQEKTVSVAPGQSQTQTIWMSTANKGNAYYCVEGFRVLSVNTSAVQNDTRTTTYSEYGRGDYRVTAEFAHEYGYNVVGQWRKFDKGFAYGDCVYIYGTMTGNPAWAVVQVSQYGLIYLWMEDLTPEF